MSRLGEHDFCVYEIINLELCSLRFRLIQEHKKILFYYPSEMDIDSKVKEVGLCEAIIKFTK